MLTMRRVWNTLLVLLLLLPVFFYGGPLPTIQAQEAPANALFKAIVERTDLPIIQGQLSRSWLWGPSGFKTDAAEPYEEGQGGKRLVQYYDKARLELTTAGRGVTSGLLAKELMTGQLQLGDNKFEQRGPSSISVAGDYDDTLAPSYADLGLLFDRAAFKVSDVISTFIRPDGTQATLSSLAPYNVTYQEYAPGWKHTIASVFKDFLNSEGLIYQDGQLVRGKLFDSALFTTGLPLTEPYWTRAKIAGKVQDVLVQGFERRVMTYAPTNANEGFRVETGNVARHYYLWRYDVTEVQLLGINDFHGRLLPEVSGGVQRGGAAYIAPVINNLRNSNPATFLIGAGDSAGATQLQSALLQDEPSIEVYNKLRFDTSSVGNHEFDKGVQEALRLLKGGKNPVRGNEWGGANFPYLVANLEYKDSGKPPVDPYVILDKGGIKVGVIGAVTRDLPTLVSPTGIASLQVLDEPTGINKYVKEVKDKGAQIVVVAIHEGGTPSVADGVERVTGRIVDIAAQVDPTVDVIISGHTHQEYVTYLSNKLVTQSGFYTRNVTSLRVRLDNRTKTIIAKRAVNVPVINALIKPDPEIDAIVQRAVRETAPIANQKISTTGSELTRTQTPAGENQLGNLIADSQRDAVKTDFAFMNPGGIRANQPAGDITYGSLFTIQPFGNIVVKVDITGDQVYRVLEQQWLNQANPRILQIAGFTYTWDNARAVGSRVIEVRGPDGQPLDRNKTYTAAVNNFLTAGGDGFTVFTETKNPVGGPLDLDALIDYIKKQPQPLTVKAAGDRITRLN